MLYLVQCKSIANWLNLHRFYNTLVKYTTVVFGIFSLWAGRPAPVSYILVIAAVLAVFIRP